MEKMSRSDKLALHLSLKYHPLEDLLGEDGVHGPDILFKYLSEELAIYAFEVSVRHRELHARDINWNNHDAP